VADAGGTRVNGAALGAIAAGILFLYAGIKGYSAATALRDIITGKSPAGEPQTMPITNQEPTAAQLVASTAPGAPGGTAEGTPGSASASQDTGEAALKQAAGLMGWSTGAQWTALDNVEMAEAGYSATVKNPSSGALGIAQALGHGTSGTAGTLGNEYGGYGLTDAEAQAANSGNAYWQSVWMVNYIAATYGTPEVAWAHEQANHWY